MKPLSYVKLKKKTNIIEGNNHYSSSKFYITENCTLPEEISDYFMYILSIFYLIGLDKSIMSRIFENEELLYQGRDFK